MRGIILLVIAEQYEQTMQKQQTVHLEVSTELLLSEILIFRLLIQGF